MDESNLAQIVTRETYNNYMNDLPILTFESAKLLRAWLQNNHTSSSGMWLRIYKKDSGVPSVTFEELLDEGLCFGWSESTRQKYDGDSYLQKFSPRKTPGTRSARNKRRVEELNKQGRMTPAGLTALGKETNGSMINNNEPETNPYKKEN